MRILGLIFKVQLCNERLIADMTLRTQHRLEAKIVHGGFTVIETLVAILVLSITIAGPLSIAFSGLRGAQLAKDEVTASYLAQEGIEFVRAKRDQDYIDNGTNEWSTFITHCEGASGSPGCWIDMTDFSYGPCDNVDAFCTTANPVEFNSTTGTYYHSAPDNGSNEGASPAHGRFTRIVKATEQQIDTGFNEYLITSTVSWRTGTIDRSVVIREIITNWQKNL